MCRIVAPVEAVELIAQYGVLSMQPPCSGMSPELAWTSLRLLGEQVLPRVGWGRTPIASGSGAPINLVAHSLLMTSVPIRPRVPDHLRRGRFRDEDHGITVHTELLELMAAAVGSADHGGHDILDIGCGVKFTQCFLTHGLPLKSYAGVDVYTDMLEFLRATVNDDRFSYFDFDVHNEMYNPDAEPMSIDSDFGVRDRKFDLVCGFSLFTHLAPHDYDVMLRLMRRVIRPTGHLYFTGFLNEVTDGGHGLIDQFFRNVPPEQFASGLGERADVSVPDFTDFTPARPLLHAVYRREFAVDLIEQAGWEVVQIADPIPEVQHQFLCHPA